MTASEALSGDLRVMQTITRHLESLRTTVDGDELYGLITRTLRRHQRHGPLGLAYLADLYRRLDTYARDAVTLPAMRIRARLLQQHIAPYLPDLELPEPLKISSEDDIPAPPLASRRSTAKSPGRNHQTSAIEGELQRPREQKEKSAAASAKRYRSLLRSENDAWQAIYGTVKDYRRLKDAWLKSLDDLAHQRDALEEKLVETTAHLSKLETEHERVRTELDKARSETKKRRRPPSVPRLVSRLAGRPAPLGKRENFVRQLQAEIRRIKRSGAPLAVGIISIENLNEIGERHGGEAAHAALRCYAEEILSNFRAYDIVALYDEDRFAVMFPETSKEGARRALEKAYKRAVETHLNHDGTSIPLPPFAGALVTYAPGEDTATLLDRADQALTEARNRCQRGIALA